MTDLLIELMELGGDLGGVDGFDALALIDEAPEGVGKGEERLGLVDLFFGERELAEFAIDFVDEEEVVDLGVVGEGGEVHRGEGGLPGGEEAAEGGEALGRFVDSIETLEGAEIGFVAFDVGAESLGGGEFGGGGSGVVDFGRARDVGRDLGAEGERGEEGEAHFHMIALLKEVGG